MSQRKLLTVFALIFTISQSLTAAVSPYNFLRYISSARASALAGCFVSMPDDAGAIYYNPATISTVAEKPISTTFLKHILDINSGNISYSLPYKDLGVFAAYICYTSYGSFDYADYQGNLGGTFGANNLAFAFAFSNKLDSNLYYGVALKFIYVNLQKYNSTALALDCGLIYKLPDGRTNIGASILNAGMQLSKIGPTADDLPLDLRLGINHRLRGLPLLINFSFHHLADQTNGFFDKFKSFAIGGELYIGQYLQLRLGYDNQVRLQTASESDKGLAGFTGGVGLKLKDFNIDYGMSRYGSSTSLHRFTVGFDI